MLYWMLVLICTLLSSASAQNWVATGSLAEARSSYPAILLPNGNVIAIAGANSLTNYVNTCELYNATTGTWTLSGSLTYARQFHTGTLLTNGNVLAAGGNNENACLNSAEVYNASNGIWTVTGSLTYARTRHTATLLPNGNVLVAGGASSTMYGTGCINSAEVYNSSIGIWTVTGSLTYARESHTATLLPNGNVLVAGGYNNQKVGLNSAEVYNAIAGVWTVTDNLAYSRAAHTATLLPNGNVLVTGGDENFSVTVILNSTEIYNVSTGVWTVTGSLAYRTTTHAAALLPNGNVLVAGGYNGSDWINTGEFYIPSSYITSLPNDLTSTIACCFVAQGVYSETTISSSLQVDCVDCDNTFTSFGNFSNAIVSNLAFTSMINLTCTNCPALAEFGIFSSQIAFQIALDCTNCPLLQSFGVFSSTSISSVVSLSCTNCSSLTSIGSFPLLVSNAPISLTCVNCPLIANTVFPSLPTNQLASSITFTCNECPSPSFALDAPIAFEFSGAAPSTFSSIVTGLSLSFVNAVLPSSLTFVGLSQLQSLSFINISGISNLDFLVTLSRVDGSVIIEDTTLSNIDGITVSLLLIESIIIENNPVLCNINTNRFQSASTNTPIINNNGFNTTCTLLEPVTPSKPSLVYRDAFTIQLSWTLPAQPSVLTTYALTVDGATFLTFPAWNPASLPYTVNSLSPGVTYILLLTATLNGVSTTSPSLIVTTESGVVSSCLPGYIKPTSAPCVPCGIAQFPSIDDLSCISCPSGTYANASALASSASCLLCPAGSYSSSAGSFECSACPPDSSYCPLGASSPLGSPLNASTSTSTFTSTSTSTSASSGGLSLGYVYFIVFVVVGFVIGLVVVIFPKRIRSMVLKFTVLIRTPRFLFRVNPSNWRLLELPSVTRGLIGLWVLLGLILVTVYQINNFVVNRFGTSSTIQPGSAFSNGESTLSATTVINISVVLFASPVSCSSVLFASSATINEASLFSPTCSSNTSTTTFSFNTTASSLPSSTTTIQLTITAANANLAYAPALQYSFTSLRYNGLNFTTTETIVGGSNGVLTGTAAVIDIAAVATELIDVNGDSLNTGYDFSYISTTVGTSPTPSSSLVLSFELSVPQYYLQVSQVQAISPLTFISGILAIGAGVVTVGTLIGFVISYAAHHWLRSGSGRMDGSATELVMSSKQDPPWL